jgi:hypothetical protein
MDTAATDELPEIPETLTITLRKPIEHAGGQIESITLREPTADEWTRWDGKEGVEADIIAISTVAGIPQVAVRKMAVRDLLKGSRYLARFLA